MTREPLSTLKSTVYYQACTRHAHIKLTRLSESITALILCMDYNFFIIIIHLLCSYRLHIHKVMVCSRHTKHPHIKHHSTYCFILYRKHVQGHGALCENLPVHWVAAASRASTEQIKDTSSIVRTEIIQ